MNDEPWKVISRWPSIPSSASPTSVPTRLAATTGTRLAPAWPCITRCQWSLESQAGSGGSVPMAVGYSSSSAPSRAMARAASGNHWSQQMPTPMVPWAVSHTRKPVSPGLK